MNDSLKKLINAINSYDFPMDCYDFEKSRPITSVTGYAELEALVRADLQSNDISVVKNGLSNVIYWGYATSAGRRNHRVTQFCDRVTSRQLERFIALRNSRSGLSLSGIRDIGLPQFSKISFVSKILMFFNPERYVVLDLQLAKIKHEKSSHLFRGLVCHPTSLPINLANTQFYRDWCAFCAKVSMDLQEQGIRPVDVERGIFTIVKRNSAGEAAQLIERLRTS